MATPEQKRTYSHYLNGAAAVSSLVAAAGAVAHTPYVGVAFGTFAGATWAGGVVLSRMADKQSQARRDPARVTPGDVDLERDAPERARGRSREREAAPARGVVVERAAEAPRTVADIGVQTESPPDSRRAVRVPEPSERDANFEHVKSAVIAYNTETFENELRRPALPHPNGPRDVEPWAGEHRSGTLLALDERGERHAVSLGRGKYEVVAADDLVRFASLRAPQREHSLQRQPSPQR